VVRDNARLDIAAGRFVLAQRQLDRVLVITPKDPVAQLYYGDLYRLQAQRAKSPIDKAELAHMALVRYRLSAELDPTAPEPHRQLGLLYYQQRLPDRAREAFHQYLALKPDAPDAKRIREYILELDR
jgi:Flp pilus assembly protein TadD